MKIVTVRDLKDAKIRLKENPTNHGLSDAQIKMIMQFDESVLRLNTAIKENIKRTADAFSSSFEAYQISREYFLKSLENTSHFVSHHWYIGYNLIAALTLGETVEMFSLKDDSSNLDKYIQDLFLEHQNVVFGEIRKAIPHRHKIIDEIEALFKSNYFHAVILLSYSQVDGICHEKLGHGFFDYDKNSQKPRVSKIDPINKIAKKLAGQLREPRNEITRYIGKDLETGNFSGDSFNRHLVMHGHTYKFGSKLNAIRSILFLDFVCFLFRDGIEMEDKGN